MNPELIAIDEDLLFDFLINKDRPVFEYDIIKHIIPSDKNSTIEQTLYVKHFSVYHALYKLKFTAGRKGYYLHLDCMRIRIVKVPDTGYCTHYNDETGRFCGVQSEGRFCTDHKNQYSHSMSSAAIDYLQDFYTDPGNISFGESEILKKLLSGVRVYCCRKKEIDRALKLFGIHKPGKKSVANRYRELAVKYHPDRCGGSDEMMKEINSAYMILKEVFVV